jgi:hypothetical protein
VPKTETIDQTKDLERNKKHERQDALIGEQIIHTLGRPASLRELQVRRLWEDHYRVNVFIGPDAASARIANSYFVQADSNGNIVRSNPTITRQY